MKIYSDADVSHGEREFAQYLYTKYTANSDNLNWQGLPCPAWIDLPEAVRGHWCAVAVAAIAVISEEFADELAARLGERGLVVVPASNMLDIETVVTGLTRSILTKENS